MGLMGRQVDRKMAEQPFSEGSGQQCKILFEATNKQCYLKDQLCLQFCLSLEMALFEGAGMWVEPDDLQMCLPTSSILQFCPYHRNQTYSTVDVLGWIWKQCRKPVKAVLPGPSS